MFPSGILQRRTQRRREESAMTAWRATTAKHARPSTGGAPCRKTVQPDQKRKRRPA